MAETIGNNRDPEKKNSPEAFEPTSLYNLDEEGSAKTQALFDVRKTLSVFNESLFKPTVLTDARNVSILEENLGDLSPDWQTRITIGGVDQYNERREVIGRVFTGEKVGSGGLGVINEVYFAHNGKNKLEKGVAKTCVALDADIARVFAEEKNNAHVIKDVLEQFPNERGAENLAKPLLISDDSIIYQKMENEQGESLSLGEATLQLSNQEWLRQFAGGVEGLAYLQRHGLGHLDFKPGNIVLGKNGEGALVDYGTLKTHGSQYNSDKLQMTLRYADPMNYPRQDLTGVYDLCDKFAIGMSLREFLVRKGVVENTDKPGEVSYGVLPLREPSSEALKELHMLYKKLSEVKDNLTPADPNYVSLQGLADQLKTIASKLPAIQGSLSQRATIAGTPTVREKFPPVS